MKHPVLQILSAVTAFFFVVCLVVMVGGFYVAIWGDNGFAGRVIATALVTAGLMFGIGYPTHLYLEKNK